MHDIRSSFVPGEGLRKTSLVAAKKKRAGEAGGSLAAVSIARTESRMSDHRREDREYHLVDQATVIHRRRKFPATVLNVSTFGAMVRCDVEVHIGTVIELQIEDCNRMRCVVRWIRSDRFGVEFDEQTDIVTTQRTRAAIVAAHGVGTAAPEAEKSRSLITRATRHGLVWTGTLYWTFEAFNVRIRNISSGGAMLDCERTLPQGAPIRLNLAEAGTLAGEVRWSRNGQIGIKFEQLFDVRLLVSAQPAKQERADRYMKPAYLQSETKPNSPWAAAWDKMKPSDFR